MQARLRIPTWATVLGWLGVISTFLGIFAFFFGDFRTFFGLNKSDSLSQQDVIGTLSAMQNDLGQAQFQLTQIAFAEAQAANSGTQQAINQQQTDLQATLGALNAQQDAFISTQNAIAGATATQSAIETQAALDAGATAAAVAQVTPTPTPEPTVEPPPQQVGDFRLLVGSVISFTDSGDLNFALQANAPIPAQPGFSYVWLLDTDFNAATGIPVQDIGADNLVTVKFENGAWLGNVQSVNADGTIGEPLLFVSITVDGASLTAVVSPATYGLPGSFMWVARAESEGATYPFLPAESHAVFP